MAKVQYSTIKKVVVDVNATNRVVASLTRNERNKELKVDIRHWYLPNDGMEFVPTSKGVSLSLASAKSIVDGVKSWLDEQENANDN